MTEIKSYAMLIILPTFEQRFEYLTLKGHVGFNTFADKRYLNQTLYKSDEWKHFRRKIIIRDCGCDLGIKDHEIEGIIVVHHINPISIEDIINHAPCIFDPNNAIATSDLTHKAIHYCQRTNDFLFLNTIQDRVQNDMCPWKKK